MAPSDNVASPRKERIFIPIASGKKPQVSESTATPATKDSSSKHEPKKTLPELSSGNLEAARKKPSQLLRVVASENGRTLFAILNFGYLPLHEKINTAHLPESSERRRSAIRVAGQRQDVGQEGQALHANAEESGTPEVAAATDQRQDVQHNKQYDASRDDTVLSAVERASANPKLTPVAEYLFLHFQERVAWNIFRHPQIMHRPHVRAQMRALLIQRYAKGAEKVAETYWNRKIPEYTLVDKHDLKQAAIFGMMQCIDLYDPAVGTTFMQFGCAKRGGRIIGSIKDSLRKFQECSRDIARMRRIVGPMMTKLAHKLGRKPTSSDFCDAYGEHWRSHVEDPMLNFRVYNQVRAQDDDEQIDHMSQVQFDGLLPDERWEDEDSEHYLAEVMKFLPDERQAFVIYAYYWLGWNNEHIAKHLNCSTSQALKIKDEAQNRINAFGDGKKFAELLPKRR